MKQVLRPTGAWQKGILELRVFPDSRRTLGGELGCAPPKHTPLTPHNNSNNNIDNNHTNNNIIIIKNNNDNNNNSNGDDNSNNNDNNNNNDDNDDDNNDNNSNNKANIFPAGDPPEGISFSNEII